MNDSDKEPIVRMIRNEVQDKGHGFPRLIPGKERRADTEVDEEQAAVWEEAWYQFHLSSGYKSFNDFFFKDSYCCNDEATQMDEEHFLQLIADREFLFLNYGEYFDTSDALPLSAIVNGYDSYLNTGYSKAELDDVLDHPFRPFFGYGEAYTEWQRNLKELTAAKTLRMNQMARIKPDFESFTCHIPSESPEYDDLDETEKVLCDIFRAYIEACEKIAYEKRKDGKAVDVKKSYSAIHEVYRTITEQEEPYCGYRAIVFFHLFSQNTEKLSSGKLKEYKFKKISIPKSINGNESPINEQHRIRGRIQCNVQLFDFLLKTFLPEASIEEKQDAKYAFYLFSRYDFYCHYEIESLTKNRISFNNNENLKDGVDHFGNLVRYHICYCIPLGAKWLIPILVPQGTENPMATLATFLLSEAILPIPTKDKLTAQIKAYQKGEKWNELLEDYVTCRFDTDVVKELLDKWRKKVNYVVPFDEVRLYEGKRGQITGKYGARLLVEFALRTYLQQKAKDNLGIAAESLFHDLCIDGFQYVDFKPIPPIKKRGPYTGSKAVERAEAAEMPIIMEELFETWDRWEMSD